MSSIIPKVQIKEEKFDPDETEAKKVPKEKKRIKCTMCKKSFSRKTDLNRHVAVVHEG